MAIPITNSQEIQNSSILGLGVYRPSRVVTNDDICRQIDSTDEWIRVRSGIRVRRFAGPDETLIDMAVRAGRDALRSSAVPPDQIGCVIVATSTFPYQTPAAGPQIAHQLAGVSPLSRAWVAFVLASRDFGVVWLYYLTVVSDHRVGA
ncbi:hypothetical protein [Rhodococcus sp. ACS1]|uniref:hypothetical protein n=1 Tax=Rhodococcus sp. ACS1 TaxID=2028570 RepID=UPI0015CC5D20